jgi:serine/tyrosine/threonine adenylyltransferase
MITDHDPEAAQKAAILPGLQNRFAGITKDCALPSDLFFSALDPTGIPDPTLLAVSPSAAALLDLDASQLVHNAQTLAGNKLWPGSTPLASVYSGHQFGIWAGQLGDGRAHLLGDLKGVDGQRWELQLKGAGPTPYSRRADGRAVLRSSIREFLASEAMVGLGIPTTRALSLVTSDQPVIRETVESAAVVCRVAPSFLRFGHFEHFYHHQQPQALQALAQYVLHNYYPQCVVPGDNTASYEAMLRLIIERTATMVAKWQAVGFCHGVMNTDNFSVLGLTIDYGPFAFMDAYDPAFICNHSDHQGRYSYQNQPKIAYWNCMCLAQCFVDLIGNVPKVQEALQSFPGAFEKASEQAWLAKIGLKPTGTLGQSQMALVQALLDLMAASRADFTIVFRLLTEAAQLNADKPPAALRDQFLDRSQFDDWYTRWRLQEQPEVALIQAANPRVILRNHMAQTAIEKAQKGDNTEVIRLMHLLADPFTAADAQPSDLMLPPDWAQHLELSCSS